MEPVYRKNTNADDHSKQTGSNWFELVSVEDREKYGEYRRGGTYLKGRKLMKKFLKLKNKILKIIVAIKDKAIINKLNHFVKDIIISE